MGKWIGVLSFDDCGETEEKWARLTKPLTYQANDGRLWFVPMGFCTDFASIPRLLQTAVGSPAGGKYRRAAVLHDYLYRSCQLSREEADALFYEAMISSGVSRRKARQLYLGVRFGGASSYGGIKI